VRAHGQGNGLAEGIDFAKALNWRAFGLAGVDCSLADCRQPHHTVDAACLRKGGCARIGFQSRWHTRLKEIQC
jgi:hypothetical protein